MRVLTLDADGINELGRAWRVANQVRFAADISDRRHLDELILMRRQYGKPVGADA